MSNPVEMFWTLNEMGVKSTASNNDDNTTNKNSEVICYYSCINQEGRQGDKVNEWVNPTRYSLELHVLSWEVKAFWVAELFLRGGSPPQFDQKVHTYL